MYLEPSEWNMASLSSKICPICSASCSFSTPATLFTNQVTISAPENISPFPKELITD